MKNNFLRFLLLLITHSTVFAQVEDLKHAKIFNKCEITYIDGHTINGFIAFFMENMNYEMEDVYSRSIENIFHLDDNHFEFKASVSDKVINMTQKDLKRIKILYEDNSFQIYDLMEVKKFDKEKNIIKSSRKAWLPLVKDDIVSLYQLNIYVNKIKTNDFNGTEKLKKTKILGTLTYLANKEQNIAFQIYDERKNFLKKNLNSSYLATVLQYIFKDCPTFLNKIMVNEKFEYQNFDTEDNQNENKNNESLSKEEKFQLKGKLTIESESKPFLKLIEAYKSTCK
jgi:hypothetical protein